MALHSRQRRRNTLCLCAFILLLIFRQGHCRDFRQVTYVAIKLTVTNTSTGVMTKTVVSSQIECGAQCLGEERCHGFLLKTRGSCDDKFKDCSLIPATTDASKLNVPFKTCPDKTSFKREMYVPGKNFHFYTDMLT